LQFVFQLWNERERLHAVAVQVEDDQRRFFLSVLFYPIAQVGFRFHELNFNVELAGGFLNLRLEEQVVHKAENARGRVFAYRQWLRVGLRVVRRKAGPLASGSRTVVTAGQGRPIAVVHGCAVNAAMLLIASGASAATAAGIASTGTTTTPPPISPSSTG